MYIDDFTYEKNNKSYRRVLMRESYREGKKVNKRTIANITHAPEVQIQAIKIALKNSDQITTMKNLQDGEFREGKSVGSLALLYQIAQKIGLLKALGKTRNALLFLWLVFARLIDQGSRLSATRLARHHAVSEIMGLEGFNENHLYKAMDWGYANQEEIEDKIFSILARDININININEEKTNVNGNSHSNPFENIFLYDVTSTYLEGEKNELAEFGYNRDKKIGKRQIVYGLLTNEEGIALSIEAFAGNTKDNKTLDSQITKLKERFGFKHVTIVGDKGMIKSMQINLINAENFNYITSITKPQIKELLKRNVIQMELFEEQLCEIFDESEGIRYILRRNSRRAKEMKQTRQSKFHRLRKKVECSNKYLSDHKRGKVETQLKDLGNYLRKLKLDKYVKVEEVPVPVTGFLEGEGEVADQQSRSRSRRLRIDVNEDKLEELSKLDGCYVIKTDLEKSKNLKKEVIHDRYKALAEVEWAFRTNKTGYLEVRPVFVRKEIRTRAHLFITMLSYRLEQFLRKCWKDIDITVEEGIKKLSKLTSVIIEGGLEKEKFQRVPKPDKISQKLLEFAGVKLPHILPWIENENDEEEKGKTVDTKTKLQNRRK